MAEQAARAGAHGVSESSARSGGDHVNTGDAIARAHQILKTAGWSGSVRVEGSTVIVTATGTRKPTFLPLLRVGTVHISEPAPPMPSGVSSSLQVVSLIPTMIIFGSVTAYWWKLALPAAAVIWPALLLASDTIAATQIPQRHCSVWSTVPWALPWSRACWSRSAGSDTAPPKRRALREPDGFPASRLPGGPNAHCVGIHLLGPAMPTARRP